MFVAEEGAEGGLTAGGMGQPFAPGGRASVAGVPGVVAPAAAGAEAAGSGGESTPAASAEAAALQGLADPGGRPRLYRCQVEAGAPLEAWPSVDTPYIRHYATLEATKFSETASRSV